MTDATIRPLAEVLYDWARNSAFRATDGVDMGAKWYWYEAEASIQGWINTHPGEEYTLEKFFAPKFGVRDAGKAEGGKA